MPTCGSVSLAFRLRNGERFWTAFKPEMKSYLMRRLNLLSLLEWRELRTEFLKFWKGILIVHLSTLLSKIMGLKIPMMVSTSSGRSLLGKRASQTFSALFPKAGPIKIFGNDGIIDPGHQFILSECWHRSSKSVQCSGSPTWRTARTRPVPGTPGPPPGLQKPTSLRLLLWEGWPLSTVIPQGLCTLKDEILDLFG